MAEGHQDSRNEFHMKSPIPKDIIHMLPIQN